MADSDKQQQPSTEDILSSIRRSVSFEEEGEQTGRKDSTGSGELNDDGDAEKQQALSTEEILSSIGRIISSGEEGGGAKTEASIMPGKSNVDVGALSAHDSFSSEAEATGQTESDNEVLELTVVIEDGADVDVAMEELVSTSTTGHHKEISPDITSIKVGELATQLMRPVMLEWPNQNLPPMVKRLVRAEIDRLKQESR